MKDILTNYYDLKIEHYKKYNEGIIFFIGGNKYYLYKLNRDDRIEYVKELYEYVISNSNIKVHKIILNKYGDINSEDYVLMLLRVVEAEVNVNDVYLFNLCNMNEYRKQYIDIGDRWLRRIDYLEDRLNKSICDSKVRYVFDYYSGIIEILVKFLGNIDIDSIDLVLAHKKSYNNTVDYYNPFNLIIDLKYRDLIYYLDSVGKLEHIFRYCTYLSDYDRKYIFFRILLPSKVIYTIELYINDEIDIEEVETYLNSIEDYEDYLSKYEELFDYYIFRYLKRSN